jgi:hypothetical protein
MTLEEFRTKSAGPITVRAEILALEQKLDGKLAERDLEDAKAGDLVGLVVSCFRGNPDYGPDCELYQALGYVRKSDRKSRLTCKVKSPPTTHPPPLT